MVKFKIAGDKFTKYVRGIPLHAGVTYDSDKLAIPIAELKGIHGIVFEGPLPVAIAKPVPAKKVAKPKKSVKI
jgi:hypothetical protein